MLVIKHLSKYGLLCPRMHSNVDSFDSCVIFLVSSQWKNKLHTVSSSTLISVVSHAKESLRVWSHKPRAIFYMSAPHNLPSGFDLECSFGFRRDDSKDIKNTHVKTERLTLVCSTATLFQQFGVVSTGWPQHFLMQSGRNEGQRGEKGELVQA